METQRCDVAFCIEMQKKELVSAINIAFHLRTLKQRIHRSSRHEQKILKKYPRDRIDKEREHIGQGRFDDLIIG